MASGKILFCLALVASLSVIWAEESESNNQSEQPPHKDENGDHDDRASFLSNTPFGSIFEQFVNSSSGLPFPFNAFSGFLNQGNREQSVSRLDFGLPDNSNESDSEHHDRFFFHLPRFTGCNYTTAPGLGCYGCRTLINCLQSNLGIVRSCGFLLPYCTGNGTCSRAPAAGC